MKHPEPQVRIYRSILLRYRFLWIGISILLLILSIAYLLALVHKKEILNAALLSFNSTMNETVAIEDADFTLFERFPNLSLRLENISITGSRNRNKPDTLFAADHVSLQLQMSSLLTGRFAFRSLKISNAEISFLTTTSGQTNANLSRESGSGDLSNSFNQFSIDKIFMRNVSFRFTDSLKQKFFSFTVKQSQWLIDKHDSSLMITTDDKVYFGNLTFNSLKGGYLTNENAELRTRLEFNPFKALLKIHPSKMKIQDEVFNLNGTFDFSINKYMAFNIYSVSITPRLAYNLLPSVISEKLSRFDLKNPVLMKAHVEGSLAPNHKPAVDVFFQTTNNQLTFGKHQFDSIELLGWFNNHVDSSKINDDRNTRIILPVFNGSFNHLPLKSEMIITDLLDPSLYMIADMELDASDQQKELDPERFMVTSGISNVHFIFNGPLVNYIDTVNQKLNAEITGKIEIRDLGLNYIPTGYEFRNVNVSMNFTEDDLYIDTLSMQINGNQVQMKGGLMQFISFIFLPEIKANAFLVVTADTLNFNSFKSPAKVADSLKKNQENVKTGSAIAATVNRIIDKLEVELNVRAEKVIVKKFIANGVLSKVIVANDYFKIKELSMSTAGGTISMSASVTQLSRNTHPLTLNAQILNTDISSLMYSFDNFGQGTVTHQNIDGKLSANIDFWATTTRHYKIIPSSMHGNLEMKIKRGKLKDFSSLSQISKYVFRNRDFTNIEFSELKNEYELNGEELNISKLDVYSSVLTFFVSGLYDMGQTNTNLLIQVPLKNLSRKKVEVLSANPDSTIRDATSLYLRATNAKDGGYLIAPVIFGKKKTIDSASENSLPRENKSTDKREEGSLNSPQLL